MDKNNKSLSQSALFTKVILPIILVAILVVIGWTSFGKADAGKLSMDDAKTQTEEFINNYLMSPGSNATITDIEKEYDMYKVKVDIGSDVVESYVTKDGKLFFPQAFNTEELASESAANPNNQAAPVSNIEVPKSEKPAVELFVMSHCPYGTQMEKGILPVVDALGDNIDFEIKFVDYAMHGEKELREQMTQYCINEEEGNDTYLSYLSCFLEAGDSASCLDQNNIDTGKLNSCVESTNNEYSIIDNFNNNVGYKGSYPGFDIHKASNTKYGVAGSPTLIINEAEVQTARDPQSLLNAICGAFEEAPEACSQTLPSATPTPGFGTGTTASASNAAVCN